MFIDLLSESCKKGGISLLGNEEEPIFRGYVLPDQPDFLAILPLFCWSYLGSARQEIIVMIIKHHTYTHCPFRL